MLTQICQYLRNWFERDKLIGTFTVEGGVLASETVRLSNVLQDGQYYRVIGSVFNDGVHVWGVAEDALRDEAAFDGAVWPMAVPRELLDLSREIEAWQAKYGGADSSALSPFASESFGGYSYSKYGTTENSGSGWQGTFAARLSPWRKI